MKNTVLAASNEPSHTLLDLLAVLGEPAADIDAAFFHGASDAELTAMGQKIATSRILTDERRIYSIAFDFWGHATEAQQRTLRGFSLPLLSLGVAHALRLQAMLADQTTRTGQSGTTRDGREREAKEAFDGALLLRDQALPLLRAVVAGDHDLSAEVESAVGTADSPENLASATQRLASVGERVLGMKRGPFTARARLMQLDTEYVDKLSAAATRLSGAAEKAKARSGGLRVTQGALDREDGANLQILGHVIDVFEAAHDLDPTIPRLAPIATRRLLGRTRKAAEKDSSNEAQATTAKDASLTVPGKAPEQAIKAGDTASSSQPA